MVKISRCALDIAMAALTLVLMGGCNFFYEAFDESFDSDLIHEILCVLFLMVSGIILSNHVFAWIFAIYFGLHSHYGAIRCGNAACDAGSEQIFLY